MKVILKSDVEKVGRAGDVKNVARGFARNYLIARGLATEATPAAIRWFEKGRERLEKARAQALAEAKSVCEKLAAAELKFERKVGEGGKLFGSVGKADIVKSLKASGYPVEKGAVILESALKEVGDFDVEIRLAPDASAKVKVSILSRG